MIQGSVSNDGVPTIVLAFAGRNWTAIIDTGFNGDIELPEEFRDILNALYVGQVTSALAGAQTIEEDVYLVEFLFEGRLIHAEATFASSSQILIGTHLLREYLLQINFVTKTVQLERASDNR